ncbi:MAG: hypothetical protein ACTSPB_10050 [Candidatus Thorarchaeota archaeon]
MSLTKSSEHDEAKKFFITEIVPSLKALTDRDRFEVFWMLYKEEDGLRFRQILERVGGDEEHLVKILKDLQIA